MKKLFFAAIILFIGISGLEAQELPSVKLKDISGKTIDTSKLSNGGKPFIISFFATWCKPCLRELAAINEVYADWQEETGVKLFAVSIDEGQNSLKVAPAVKSYGWEYEVLLDPNGDFKRALSVNLIPATFVVDGNGKIAHTHSGYTSGSEEKLIEEVRKLIKK
ncbi:MAG: TlpA family protein disulfide reductase [Dysgonamonadaceae bacterium]|jgi:peroxiredoxin|nr:TlpA family protein disulfide reductase [Dysgonamonadaceae bacterium]